MYKHSVPIYNSHVTKERRAAYLQSFQRAEISRVFLIASYSRETGEVNDYALLCENIAWLKQNGIEAGIWVGETIGHGGLVHNLKQGNSTKNALVSLSGEPVPGTFCPLTESFGDAMCRLFRTLAGTGVEYILIDDDFRLSYHGREFFCFCDKHLSHISALCGEQVTRELLQQQLFTGGPNRYRDAYFKAMGDSLRALARRIRSAVDEVDRSISLALCMVHNHWDADGVDPMELTQIFRGDAKPLLRLHGAPYWASISADKSLAYVFEMSRMFAAFSQGSDFELMNEDDTYPRPRMRCPASYLTLHDAVMRADKTAHGTLKYMYDYVSTLPYEQGYLDAHCRHLPHLRDVEKRFEKGKQAGVGVVIFPNLLKDVEADITLPKVQSPLPTAGSMLAHCSIPTTYLERDICRAIFGESIKRVPNSDLDGGLVLDATSALLLDERGVDVGLAKGQTLRTLFSEPAPSRIHSADRSEQAMLLRNKGRILQAALADGAAVQLYISQKGEEEQPLCYRYENAKGQRFLVWLFDSISLERDSDLIQGYLIEDALSTGIEWAAQRPLPAKCPHNPGLYIMCREGESSLTVALFNCFADEIPAPTVQLNGGYHTLDCSNVGGKLQGDTVVLDTLPAFSFTAFTVTK